MDKCTIEKYLRGFTRRTNTNYYVISKNCFSTVVLFQNRPTLVVCNTSETYPGQHWVAFYVYWRNSIPCAEFFDSFGKSPQYYEINPPFFVCKYNRSVFQSDKSDSCGLFCLFFLYYRLKKQNFKKIIRMFSKFSSKNELLVNKFLLMISRRYK